MMDGSKITIDSYKGQEIAFDQKMKRFVLTGPLWDKDEAHWFDTYEQATAKVDRTEKTRAKAKMTKLKMEVVTDDGTVTNIKGIHAKHGTMLFDDGRLSALASGSFSSVTAYPNVDWVRTLIARKKAISAELMKINRTLGSYEIGPERTYGNMSPERLDDIIEKLRKGHHEKTMKARNHTHGVEGKS